MGHIVIAYHLCVGCGACAEVCPEIFEMIGDKAWLKMADDIALCEIARTICPVGAITIEEDEK